MEEQIKTRILELKKEKNAVILAHYYAPGEIQSIADYVGDSFYLAKVAKESHADIIVFAGVYFMGESAKLLNPTRKVLMPDPTADCPMAHMVKKGRIEEMRARYDDLAVVAYINSSAELKSQSDVCVTSSNAVRVVRALPNKNVFFIPDRNLGRYVAEQVKEKNIILNDGCCPIHDTVSAKELEEEKRRHPDALVLAHPECGDAVLALADYIGSTADMIAYVKKSEEREFIVATEEGISFCLETQAPEKRFYFPKTRPVCVDMKLNTPERLLYVLETEKNEIFVDEAIQKKALAPLEKMLEMAK